MMISSCFTFGTLHCTSPSSPCCLSTEFFVVLIWVFAKESKFLCRTSYFLLDSSLFVLSSVRSTSSHWFVCCPRWKPALVCDVLIQYKLVHSLHTFSFREKETQEVKRQKRARWAWAYTRNVVRKRDETRPFVFLHWLYMYIGWRSKKIRLEFQMILRSILFLGTSDILSHVICRIHTTHQLFPSFR